MIIIRIIIINILIIVSIQMIIVIIVIMIILMIIAIILIMITIRQPRAHGGPEFSRRVGSSFEGRAPSETMSREDRIIITIIIITSSSIARIM